MDHQAALKCERQVVCRRRCIPIAGLHEMCRYIFRICESRLLIRCYAQLAAAWF